MLVGALISIAAFAQPVASREDQPIIVSQWNEAAFGPLPRHREGGTPVEDYETPFQPYAVSVRQALRAPTSGTIASPPEYSPTAGVLFRYSTTAWPTVVRDCVAALTADPAHDEIAYVVVASASQQSSATSQFIAAGADMSKVHFIILPNDSIWLRDYGPHFIWQSGTLAIVDSHYYPTRPLDNFIPTLLGENYYGLPTYAMGLYYSGGNFQPGPARSGFVTSLINQDNFEMNDAEVRGLYQEYQGIDVLHIFPRLPSTVDATGHIDMWMYLVDEDTAIISEFLPGSNSTALSITNNAVPYMEGLGFEVFRVPAWNAGGTHYTYANAFRVNDRIFIPVYGPGNANYLDEDQLAIAAWQAAAGPGVEIVPINCYSIIPAAGAIHCIVMQVPRYEAASPSAHLCNPDGGEMMIAGEPASIRWGATDDVSVTTIDLAYSTDGGSTFPHVIATGQANDGHYQWTVPDTLSDSAVVQLVARDDDDNTVEVVSAAFFQIAEASVRVYDFSSGAGVNKWGWGHQTSSWASVNGVRYPPEASTEINALQGDAYAALSAADAAGTDGDLNRYRAPIPGGSFETTHIFEFIIDEDPQDITDMAIIWEGYADDCTQIELYVWDDQRNNWGDGAGAAGLNAYMENFAGNRDARFEGHIRGDFDHYLNSHGRLTLLLYGERAGDRSFHDYLAVAVAHPAAPPCSLASDCADADADLVRDDACMWWDCAAGACAGQSAAFADLGGGFGSCAPDGFTNLHDRNHVLNCFDGTSACDSINMDAGGGFGSCDPDGFCNLHDVTHVLTTFASSNPCTCAPSPAFATVPRMAGGAVLSLYPTRQRGFAGQVFETVISLESDAADLMGYQLQVAVSGGRRGALELLDITIEPRLDHVFAGRTGRFEAFNTAAGRMLAGVDGAPAPLADGGYLATLKLQASPDAAGVFLIDLLHHQDESNQSFLVGADNAEIEILNTQPAVVEVQPRQASR